MSDAGWSGSFRSDLDDFRGRGGLGSLRRRSSLSRSEGGGFAPRCQRTLTDGSDPPHFECFPRQTPTASTFAGFVRIGSGAWIALVWTAFVVIARSLSARSGQFVSSIN